MKRRTLITSVGAVAVAGCPTNTTTEREATAELLDLGLDRREVFGFFYDGQELGRFAMGTGAWVNVPYEFNLSAGADDGLEWLWCTVEFAFPDVEFRPPYIYLLGDTTATITSFDRRSLTDEFTMLEIQEPTDEFDFEFRAQPRGSTDDDIEEIPIELNFEGKLADNGNHATEYTVQVSVSSTLDKELH